MTFDDYISARNEMIQDKDYRYNTYRHVAYRLWERYGFSQTTMRMAKWEEISYACARRLYQPFHKTKEAMYFKIPLDGVDVMWLYNKSRRCVVTVVPLFEIDQFRIQYENEFRINK